MRMHYVGPIRCPECGASASGASNADGHSSAPEAGHLSICGSCAVILVYEGAPLRLRKMTRAEIESLPPGDRETLLRTAAGVALSGGVK